MEPSTPSEQPQRVIKVWSHNVIGNITLLAMLTLVVLGWPPFNVGVSMSSALALGAFTGFVVAAINWFRMGRRWKGLIHLVISPAVYLMFPVGIPLLLTAIVYVLSGGSAERASEISRGIDSVLIVALYFGIAFLIIAYLYRATKRAIAQVQAKGINVEYAGSLPPVGIAALSVTFMWGITTVAGQVSVASVQNHVYCELLQPGMTKEEVEAALKEVGPLYQVPTDGWPPQYRREKDLGEYRIIYWDESDVELRYDLWMWVGYDKNGKLDWRGRYSSSTLISIECPWTFQQSVTAR